MVRRVRIFVGNLVRSIADPPVKRAAQRVAGRSNQNGWPEKLWVEFYETKNHGLGAKWKQRCGDEGNYKNRAEPVFW